MDTFRTDEERDRALSEFARVFRAIPKRGPTQDESQFGDAFDAAGMRAIESGRKQWQPTRRSLQS